MEEFAHKVETASEHPATTMHLLSAPQPGNPDASVSAIGAGDGALRFRPAPDRRRASMPIRPYAERRAYLR